MVELSMQEVAEATGGRLVGADARCRGLSTDTRSLNAGELFVALKGECFDAHAMLADAARAAGLVVAREVPGRQPQVVVDDTRRALGALARHWRRRFDLPVVAITGSNGKTTTKELVASILRQQGETHATSGNLNNDIGVPLTLFGLGDAHRFAVIEMGANAPDDISQLVGIAEPTVALVTLCGPSHLEGFGSIEGVARAKGQIYTRLGATGVAVINLDDPFHAQWLATAAAARHVTFGLGGQAQVTARDITPVALGEGTHFTLCVAGATQSVHLPLDGLHNVRNALAAAAVGVALGLPLDAIRRGLETAPILKGRLNLRRSASGLVIIDDTYNANPVSLAAALALLAGQPGRRWLVLGDMGELGPDAPHFHAEAGIAARAAGVERLFAIGPLSAAAARAFGAGASCHATRASALEAIRSTPHDLATVLVKGSRAMQLDLLVKDLVAVEASTAC